MSATLLADDEPTAGRCLLCGGSGSRIVWSESGHDGIWCACGIVFVSPIPDEAAIDPTVDGHTEAFYRLPAAYKVARLAPLLPGRRLLEIGCGSGFFLAAAQAAGYAVTGIEPHPQRAELARHRTNATVHCARFEGLAPPTLAHDRFDAVYHCDLLSHFADPIAALEGMQAWLRPGGVLCFEVGLTAGVGRRWYAWTGRLGFPQHRWLFDETGLRRVLDRAGLEVVGWLRHGLGPSILAHRLIQAAGPVLRGWFGQRHRHREIGTGAADRATATPGARDWRQWALAGHDGLQNLLRYQVGRRLPEVGPGTVLVVARVRGSAP